MPARYDLISLTCIEAMMESSYSCRGTVSSPLRLCRSPSSKTSANNGISAASAGGEHLALVPGSPRDNLCPHTAPRGAPCRQLKWPSTRFKHNHRKRKPLRTRWQRSAVCVLCVTLTHDPQRPLHQLRAQHRLLEVIIRRWVWTELFVNASFKPEHKSK